MPLSQKRLVYLNAIGLFAGPCESEEAFLSRSALTKTPDSLCSITENLFGFTAGALEICYSKQGLMPWQGGCTVVEEGTCVVQLKKKGSSLFYSSDEIKAHESVHVARMLFDEPKYEEILAYQTSKSWFRRYFGPIVQSGKEAAFFVLTVGALACGNLAALFFPKLLVLQNLFFVVLGSEITFALTRLVKRQNTFKKCLNNLKKGLKEPSKALGIALHFTDVEIELFAKKNAPLLADFVQTQNTLRWQQITALAIN